MPFLNLALFMICFFSLSTFEKIFLLIRQKKILLVVCSFHVSLYYTFFVTADEIQIFIHNVDLLFLLCLLGENDVIDMILSTQMESLRDICNVQATNIRTIPNTPLFVLYLFCVPHVPVFSVGEFSRTHLFVGFPSVRYYS